MCSTKIEQAHQEIIIKLKNASPFWDRFRLWWCKYKQNDWKEFEHGSEDCVDCENCESARYCVRRNVTVVEPEIKAVSFSSTKSPAI